MPLKSAIMDKKYYWFNLEKAKKLKAKETEAISIIASETILK